MIGTPLAKQPGSALELLLTLNTTLSYAAPLAEGIYKGVMFMNGASVDTHFEYTIPYCVASLSVLRTVYPKPSDKGLIKAAAIYATAAPALFAYGSVLGIVGEFVHKALPGK